ncbi:MAG: class I SAM-dependent methyltransferase [Gemmatimonadales bacterium]|nr:class I SAM-dependent methyltransferase [Gemmatimonadales bacterium]
MFTRSAPYYDRLYHFLDYADAAERVRARIRAGHPKARTLLDVGCGTGKHLEHLSREYDVAGLDLNPELLRAARKRCPDISLHQGNMIEFDLSSTFDVLTCLFSSIAYVKTLDNLRRTLANFARHLRPGGIALIEPWFTPESFWTGTVTTNFADAPDLKIVWMYTSTREDRVAILDMHYLIGRPSGVEHFTERQELGLFTHEEYLAGIRDAGLEPEHDPVGLFRRGLYIGRCRA